MNIMTMSAAVLRRSKRCIVYTLTLLIALKVCSFVLLETGVFRNNVQQSRGKDYPDSFRDKFVVNTNESQACKRPNLQMWSEEIEDYFEIDFEPTYECDDDYMAPWVNTIEEPWVYTAHGKFYISSKPVRDHGEVTCEYADITLTSPVYVEIKNGSDVMFDTFHVVCKAADLKAYRRIHASTCVKNSRSAKQYTRREEVPFNVLWYGFDSLSRLMFQRLLPRTHEYFTRVLNGTVLQGYNIVGDGTIHAFIPMLTGYHLTEIPEVRKAHPGRKYLDEAATFIWQRYEKKGYVTQYGQDMILGGGLFDQKLTGFKTKPVTHSMNIFQMALEKGWPAGDWDRNCVGTTTKHAVFVDWLKESLATYTAMNTSLFSIGFFSKLSHDNNRNAPNLEETNIKFLESLQSQGLLDNTILILMSDHGGAFSSLRVHEQGKLEERLPYFGIRLPPKFKQMFPHKAEMLATNAERLTTPYDIHETLLDLIGESEPPGGNRKNRGLSLFNEVPKERTCNDAGIDPHWCACMVQTDIPISEPRGVDAVHHSVLTINKILDPYRQICHEITLQGIIKLAVLETNEQLLKFKNNIEHDHLRPNLSDSTTQTVMFIQATFVTSPGDAMFEATVSLDLQHGGFYLNEENISRINRYGDAPRCIVNKNPKLQPFCFCR